MLIQENLMQTLRHDLSKDKKCEFDLGPFRYDPGASKLLARISHHSMVPTLAVSLLFQGNSHRQYANN